MEVSKVPADIPLARAGSAPAAEQGTQSPASTAPPADRADIRPLDISGALQILLAEVRAEFDMLLEASSAAGSLAAGGSGTGSTAARGAASGEPADGAPTFGAPTPGGSAAGPLTPGGLTTGGPGALAPFQAARELVEMLLQALPDDAGDVPAWTGALVRVEGAIQAGIDRAMGVVSQWRDVPAVAVDAVRETRVLFSSALSDDAEYPPWLPPEWMGLGSMFHRFRRRRRNARRLLSDPDYSRRSLD
jgi:hypothetical protein